MSSLVSHCLYQQKCNRVGPIIEFPVWLREFHIISSLSNRHKATLNLILSKTRLRVNPRPRVDIFKMKLRQCHFFRDFAIWSNLIQFDPIWSNLIQFNQVWSNLIQFEQVWSSLNNFEQDWTRLNKYEQVWTSLNKFEQDLTS